MRVPADPPPLLDVRDVSVGWGRRPVLAGVTFALRPGDWLGIVGPNGSGKTTLLRALLGTAPPLAGTIVRSPSWRPGSVPQRDALDPLFRFSVHEVVAMAADIGAWLPFSRRGERRRAAAEALGDVGMSALAGRSWRDLSGGQRQRVLLARALASSPTVLVLDEPTAGLDLRGEDEVLGLVRSLREARGLAVLHVTHVLDHVADDATQVGLLADGRAAFGPTADVLTAERLTALYGCPTEVHEIRDRTIVRTARRRPA